MMVDFSTPEGKALFESEVRKRMEAPFYMGREQAEMMVAVLLWHPPADQESDHLAEQCTTLLRENERLTSLLVDQFDNNAKIAKLRAENAAQQAMIEHLRDVLTPFAECAAPFGQDWMDTDEIACEPMENDGGNGNLLFTLKVSEFRAAELAVKPCPKYTETFGRASAEGR
jgi:hypothetical protein